jgi:serine protease
VIADVSGYFTHPSATPSPTATDGSFQPLTPQRIFDTRVGLNVPKQPIGANGVRTITVAGRGRVPLTGATSVVVHVIAAKTTANGYLTVFPANLTTRPNASNVNFYAGKAASNAVIVKLYNGQIKVANSTGSTDVVVDVMGWYS